MIQVESYPRVPESHRITASRADVTRGRVVAEQAGIAPRNAVRLLARNHPPPIPCEKCGAPALAVCTQCIYEGRGWVCASHSRTHKCGEDMMLPVVNSPRVGRCGYAGYGIEPMDLLNGKWHVWHPENAGRLLRRQEEPASIHRRSACGR